MPDPQKSKTAVRRVNLWAAMSGFGLAGLFDSLVLHRLLGWHHLLSQVVPQAGLTRHIRADALFDAAMLVALCAGLVGALADRRTVARIHPRCVTGMVLNGFGVWHLADAVLVHWVLGLHRIRPDAETPIVWDLGWLAVFGLLPLLIGFSMRDTTDAHGDGDG